MTYLTPGYCDDFIEQQVMVLLADYFQLERRKILFELRLVEDLYVDSMNIVEMAVLLNEAFDIELPESGVARWRTVADVCRLVGVTRQQRVTRETTDIT